MKAEMKTNRAIVWISSRCPASLVRCASLRSRTPAVMLYLGTSRCARPLPSRLYRPCRSSHSLHSSTLAVAYLLLVRSLF
jgi:hypothetical protein